MGTKRKSLVKKEKKKSKNPFKAINKTNCNFITVKIPMSNFNHFKQIRMSNKDEIGGAIKLKCIFKQCGIKKSLIIPGKNKSIDSDLIPNCEIQYHTHPSYPQPKNGENLLDFVYNNYKSNKESNKDAIKQTFLIDSLVQTVSDADLKTFSESILGNKSKAMLVFAPEGIYTLNEDKKYLPMLKLIPQESREEILKSKSKHYIKLRNELIYKKLDELIVDMDGKSEKNCKDCLNKFQRDIGKKFATLMNDEFNMLDCSFSPWNSRNINFKVYASPKGGE